MTLEVSQFIYDIIVALGVDIGDETAVFVVPRSVFRRQPSCPGRRKQVQNARVDLEISSRRVEAQG